MVGATSDRPDGSDSDGSEPHRSDGSEPGGAGPGAVGGADAVRPWHRGAGTGIGSLPGTSPDEAASMVAGELPELPHLAELPARGVGADLVGRTAGLLVDIAAEVVPSGWRVTRRPGRDLRRATDLMAWDLDAVQQQYGGATWVKAQVCGPWTLAAMLELPDGNRMLTDAGAVDDLAASLAEGVAAHVDEIRARVPGARVVVQVDEPALPAVLAARVPTASGFGTLRAVAAERAQTVLQTALAGVADGPTIAHCCASDAPVRLLRSVGFDAVAVDLTIVGSSAARLDPIGELVEDGGILVAGIVPSVLPPSGRAPSLRQTVDPLLAVWDRLGFARDRLPGSVVPAPTCGLAEATPAWAAAAMKRTQELAQALIDPPAGW